MRSMVEGHTRLNDTAGRRNEAPAPPPPYGWSPSPEGEELGENACQNNACPAKSRW
jgi:hypothetical protein